MEQFLDYRQVPTATEANETNQEIRNGHAEEVKETLSKDETDEKGWNYFVKAVTKRDRPKGLITTRCGVLCNFWN